MYFFKVYLISLYTFTFVGRETIVSKVSHIILAGGTTHNTDSMIFKVGRGKGKALVGFPECMVRREHIRLLCL